MKNIQIRTADKDVLVLAITNYFKLEADELWVAFGTGKHLHCIAAHEIAKQLGEEQSWALLGFHSSTGCDTVSFIAGKGKRLPGTHGKGFDHQQQQHTIRAAYQASIWG